MQLTARYLSFVDQQLVPLCQTTALQRLALYLGKPSDNAGPALELVWQWPDDSQRQLPAVDLDPELRLPARERRWYPLQDGSLILGAIRAELDPTRDWSPELDHRLRSSTEAMRHALSLELECLRLRQALRDQRDQTSTLIHQLRNPLSALRTYAQLLMRRLEPDSQHRDLVEGMLSEQTQISRYLDALDGLGHEALPSAPGSDSPLMLPPGLSPVNVNMRELLEPLIERAAATASLQGRLWHGPEQWPEWSCRPSASNGAAVLEIVANLLENAFRYSPSGCSIGLLLLDDGLCIWDDGPGIPEDERTRIFQRGERGSAGRERPGTGLGLALARDLARQEGGELNLIIPPASLVETLPPQGNAFLLSWPTAPGPLTTA